MISPATGIANRFHPYSKCWMSRKVKWRDHGLPPPGINDAMTHRYLRKMESSPFINHLVDGTLPLIWAKTRLLSDDPARGKDRKTAFTVTAAPVRYHGLTSERIDIISSYLYRHAQVWRNSLSRMVRKGVKIAILQPILLPLTMLLSSMPDTRAGAKNCSAMAWNY